LQLIQKKKGSPIDWVGTLRIPCDVG